MSLMPATFMSPPVSPSHWTYTSFIHKLGAYSCIVCCVSVTGSDWAPGRGPDWGEKSEGRWSSPWLDSNSVHPILITYGSHPREHLPSSVFSPPSLHLLSPSLQPSPLIVSPLLPLPHPPHTLPIFLSCFARAHIS